MDVRLVMSLNWMEDDNVKLKAYFDVLKYEKMLLQDERNTMI